MTKQNLPILLLRNLVLLPHNEIRIEFDEVLDKQLISLSEAYYNNEVLVLIPNNQLEEEPDKEELPDYGILAEIKMKIEMPNGKIRVILHGKSRVSISSVTKEDNLYEGMYKVVESKELEDETKQAYLRVIQKELNVFEKETNFIDINFINELYNINDVEKLSEILANILPGTLDRKLQYIKEIDLETRINMILEDMTKELEVITLEKEIESKLSRFLETSQKEFVLREKIRIIKEELGEGFDKDKEIDILKKSIEKLDAPSRVKDRLNDEVRRYESININSPELGMTKGYIDYLLALPWNKVTKDEKDLVKVSDLLNETHYGLDVVKERMIEYLAVAQNTNNLRSPIICLVGPPGVGKTSLAISIAKSLKRKDTKISVGGINDEADIIGHRRTYIGAQPGLIIQGIKKAGVSNPVFIIDEIDKMTKGIQGDPASALLEVLDPEQNKTFVDHYIEEEYDLSKVMFIATANYLWQIPRALRDRLEIVELSSYTEYEKLDIAKIHLIPKLLKEHGLESDEVVIDDDIILQIVRLFTKESGVRELERLIATILRKVVKDKLLTKEDKKYIITHNNLEKYLGKIKYTYNANEFLGKIGVVNGLAYTEFGGDILQIEATMFKGNGKLILTGSLGDVMKESANLVYSFVKSNAKLFKINEDVFSKHNIHIHVPSGATPKDGPSAGISIATTLISLLTNTPVSNLVAMTGEMTLRGKVLPIGGVKEKVIGASRSGVKRIFLPKDNIKDLDEVPDYLLKQIEIISVDTYNDIFKVLFNKIKRKPKETNFEKITLDI